MNNIGVNVQPQTVLPGEWERIRAAYPAGILAIIDWQEADDAIPGGLAFPKIGMWRFTQDPRRLGGWPHNFILDCQWAVFANEPDIEGWPEWYLDVCRAWRASGGKIVQPAWHYDHGQVSSVEYPYDAVSWHCYAGDFRNRDAVLARANGRPVFGTEYGVPNNQQRCLSDLTQAGVTETVFLFAWRWQGNSYAGYDLAGVTMDQPAAAPAQPATIYERQWRGLNPSIALNPDAAIFKYWLRWREMGETAPGIPCSDEQPYPDGGDGAVFQLFTGAVAIWTPANGVEWR